MVVADGAAAVCQALSGDVPLVNMVLFAVELWLSGVAGDKALLLAAAWKALFSVAAGAAGLGLSSGRGAAEGCAALAMAVPVKGLLFRFSLGMVGVLRPGGSSPGRTAGCGLRPLKAYWPPMTSISGGWW